MTDRTDDRSLGDLIAELSRETGVLVRKEIELARLELSTKAKQAGRDVGMAAVGGALAYAGLLVLLAAIVIGIVQLGVTPWLATLIVALAAIAIGYMIVSGALTRLRRASVAPTQTIETLKENAKWATGQKA
jgi:formate hydrogenlyase subunit 4